MEERNLIRLECDYPREWKKKESISNMYIFQTLMTCTVTKITYLWLLYRLLSSKIVTCVYNVAIMVLNCKGPGSWLNNSWWLVNKLRLSFPNWGVESVIINMATDLFSRDWGLVWCEGSDLFTDTPHFSDQSWVTSRALAPESWPTPSVLRIMTRLG